MKITVLASGEFAVPTVDALVHGGHEVVIATQPARPAGRGRKARPTAVAAHAATLGVPCEEIEDVNALAGLEWITATTPDVLAVVAFGQKLGSAVRAIAPWGCVNIHPSLLPRWRGAAPVPAALLAGDERTGVCVIDVVERMDAGDVLARKETAVAGKTAAELLDELALDGAELLLEVLDRMAQGDLTRRPQDESAVTRSRKLSRDDGRVRWEHDARDVDRRVRATTPRPGAFTLLPDGTRLAILRGGPDVLPALDPPLPLPGEIIPDEEEGLLVACGREAYRLHEVRPEGSKAMAVDAYLRGHPLPDGARFGP